MYSNDSYIAEKAWDNLYDRNEDVQPKDCPECSGNGLEEYSDCCGARVLYTAFGTICEDCKDACVVASENCDVCKGEGVIYND